jgi:tetratricopeptide (TPR) repeat protein
VLTVQTREADALAWGSMMMNLGVAWKDRVAGDRKANIDKAIVCYQDVLTVQTRDTDAAAWAMTMMNLGNAWQDCITGDRKENIEKALACYEGALTVRTRDADAVAWAATTCNLGITWKNRIAGNREENIETAIACSQNALMVRTRETDAVAWATTMFNLGLAWSGRVTGGRKRNLELARTCLSSSLHVFPQEAHSLYYIQVSRNLSCTLLCLEHCDEADLCAAAALVALKEVKRNCDRGLVHARSLSEENAALYETLVFCRASKDDKWSALSACEESKAQDLSSLFAQSSASLVAALSVPERSTYHAQVACMRHALYKMEQLTAQHQDHAVTMAEYASAKVKVEAIESKAGGSRGFALQPAPSLRLRDVLPTFPDDVIAVSFFHGPVSHNADALDLVDGVYAFAAYRGFVYMHSARDLDLDVLGTEDLEALLSGPLHLLGVLLSELLSRMNLAPTPPRRIVISSHRELHRLPLLAMKVSTSADGPAQYLCDAFPGGVYFVPNLFMYAHMEASDPAGHAASLSASALPDAKFVSFTGPAVGCASESAEDAWRGQLFA